MHKFIASLVLSFTIITALASTEFDTGVAAYQRHDYKKAHAIWLQMAEHGDVAAQVRLGALSARGEGTPKDLRKSYEWYLKAARAGHAEAQYMVAMKERFGSGTPIDLESSIEWLKKSAAQGFELKDFGDAQYELGMCYWNVDEQPNGTQRDFVLAYAWLELSAAKGNETARVNLLALAKMEMNPSEVAEAKRLASSWHRGTVISRTPDYSNAAQAPNEATPPAQASGAPLHLASGSAQSSSLEPQGIAATNEPFDIAGTAIFWILMLGGLVGYFALRAEKKNDIVSSGQNWNSLVGINGWLRFLVISLGILGPALSLGNVAAGFYLVENMSPPLALPQAWPTYKAATWLTLGLFSAFSIYVALQLHFTRKPASVNLAKAALVAWPIGGVFVGIVIPQIMLRDAAVASAANHTGQMIVSIVLSMIWLAYLSKSKRVTATYFERQAHTQPARMAPSAKDDLNSTESPAEPSIPSKVREADKAAEEEEMYDEVGAELESGNLHKATWLKAFAQASGDENVAKAIYIKLRIEKLQAEKSPGVAA